MLMMEWFKDLSKGEWIAVASITVTVILAAIGGIIKLLRKQKDSSTEEKTIHQEGSGQAAANIDGDKNIIAGGYVNTGIDSKDALNTLVETSTKLGRSEKENEQLRQRVRKLEEQLAKPSLVTSISSEKSTPIPSKEAKDLAAQIEDDAGPYAQALKAIAESDNEKADELLDETQQFLDRVQLSKDEAQAKIYTARMQNATYAGRPQDALQFCEKLRPLAGNDTLILNEMAVVYYANAEYKEAEPLMKRALAIDEASFGKDHPKVARDLNNLAQLYQDTNRLSEAEPLMKRALAIFEKSFGPDHPNTITVRKNLERLEQ